jgi:hypothetical protein
MPVVDYQDAELLAELEERFFVQLRKAVAEVFAQDTDIVNDYRRAFDEAPPAERLLALHEAPIDVASRLTGIPYPRSQPAVSPPAEGGASVADIGPSPRLVPRVVMERLFRELGYRPVEISGFKTLWKASKPEFSLSDRRTEFTIERSPYRTPDGHDLYPVSFITDLLDHIFYEKLPSHEARIVRSILGARPPDRKLG